MNLSKMKIVFLSCLAFFILACSKDVYKRQVWWIRQSILQALAEQSRIVRLPLNQVGSLNKINKAFSRFEQENERCPSPEELADSLDLPAEKVADTLRVSGRHISVDAPFRHGSIITFRRIADFGQPHGNSLRFGFAERFNGRIFPAT